MSASHPTTERDEAAPLPCPVSDGSRLGRLDGFTIEIIDRPAATLGAMAEPVLAALLTLSRANLASDPESYLRRHFAEASTLIVLRLGTEIVGLSLASQCAIAGRHFLWVRQTVLAPGARGAMLMQRVTGVHLWRAVRAAWPKPFYLMTRTGNPRVVGALVAAPQFYPRPGKPTPRRLREAATAFAEAQGWAGAFDAEALVLRSIVSQAGPAPDAPHRDPRINDFCRQHLVDGGDRFLMVARASWLGVAASALITSLRGRLSRHRMADQA